jgi:hypothetical protein
MFGIGWIKRVAKDVGVQSESQTYGVFQTAFILDGGQFRGLPVLGGSELMVFWNSSMKSKGLLGIITIPFDVFLRTTVSPISSLNWPAA